MDTKSKETLKNLLLSSEPAALGTLRDGAPEVSMVTAAAAADGSAFYIHISRLAHHTQNLLADPRVSLMLSESGGGSRNPQTLARLSIRGAVRPLDPRSAEFETSKALYLERFPKSAFNFGLGDFILYEIRPESARYVAGFGRIFDLTGAQLQQWASQTE